MLQEKVARLLGRVVHEPSKVGVRIEIVRPHEKRLLRVLFFVGVEQGEEPLVGVVGMAVQPAFGQGDLVGDPGKTVPASDSNLEFSLV